MSLRVVLCCTELTPNEACLLRPDPIELDQTKPVLIVLTKLSTGPCLAPDAFSVATVFDCARAVLPAELFLR